MLNKIGMNHTTDYRKIGFKHPENAGINRLLFQNPVDKLDIHPSNKVVSFTGHNFEFKQTRNTIHYVSFSGIQDPQKSQPIGIQMKVTGVMNNQANSVEKRKDTFLGSVDKLADSFWKDGQFLGFAPSIKVDKKEVNVKNVKKGKKGKKGKPFKPVKIEADRMALRSKEFGELGRIPDEIYPALKPFLNSSEYKSDFHFELSNVLAGTTKGASTVGLRVNLLYEGQDPIKKAKIQDTFNEILNDTDCSDKVMLYQPKTSPDEVLKLIFDHDTAKTKSPESAKKMETAISNILKEVENPENQNFLVVGHCKPDGDTLGAVLGFKNAMALKYPDKNIDCAIDDKIPGLFRHKMPGIDGVIKRPINEDRINYIDETIKQIEAKPQNLVAKTELDILRHEKTDVQNVENQLKPKAPYDVVVMFDVPTPERFSGAFRQYLVDEKGNPKKNSQGKEVKVIYIDHHPHRLGEWQAAQKKTGVDMDKIHQDGLAWIADAVPAATQLVGVLASKMLPDLNKIASGEEKPDQVFKTHDQQDKLKAFVAGLVTGMSTDTGAFLRTANLLPEDMPKPAQQRPNFMPEGMSKWFMGLTDGLKNIEEKPLNDLKKGIEKITDDKEEVNQDKFMELINSRKETIEEKFLNDLTKGFEKNKDEKGNIEDTSLLNLIDDINKASIDKKWLREEITFDIEDEKRPSLPMTARETMLSYAVNGKKIPEDKELGCLGLGIVQVNYENMFNVWDLARNSEKEKGNKAETTFLDIQNAFKYSEVMNTLRADPAKTGKGFFHNQELSAVEMQAKENYVSKYDADRIGILICQDKKAGFLDEKVNLADQNGLRLSFRSQDGTIHAELLAQMFGGGGHGGASGGRVDLPGIELDTPLGVEIAGEKGKTPAEVLSQLEENYKIMNNETLSEEQKKEMCKKVKVVKDETGKPCADLITDVVTEIRKKQPVQDVALKSKNNVYKLNQKGSKNSDIIKLSKELGRTNNFLNSIAKKSQSSLNNREKQQLNQLSHALPEIEKFVNSADGQNDKLVKVKERLTKIQETLANREQQIIGQKAASSEMTTVSVDLAYKNILQTPLKSTPNINFKRDLRSISGIVQPYTTAETRISSLSTYLKEKMIGFEVPEYEFNGVKRGGYQWFERGLENLLKGSKGSKNKELQPKKYKDTAKELFGLLSVHDQYWKSPEFADYLSSLKTSKTITENQKKAVDATIQAISELNGSKTVSFTGQNEIRTPKDAYFTPMKYMPEILKNCAYSGEHLIRYQAGTTNQPKPEEAATIEHLTPYSWSGNNDDGNYIMVSHSANEDRGNIQLIEYLKGHTAEPYLPNKPYNKR